MSNSTQSILTVLSAKRSQSEKPTEPSHEELSINVPVPVPENDLGMVLKNCLTRNDKRDCTPQS
jgi:hypothetical protein